MTTINKTKTNNKTTTTHFAKVELYIALESDQTLEDIQNNYNEDFINAKLQINNGGSLWLDTDVLSVSEVDWSKSDE